MFPPERLGKLSPAHRLRKAALLLTALERGLMGEGGEGGPGPGGPLLGSARAVAARLAAFPETPPAVRLAAAELASAGEAGGAEALRALDRLRHELLRAAGQGPADWDLIDPGTGRAERPRSAFPGMKAWLEDIRSPFNVGSMLRSGEAFGLEELVLSPGSGDPGHPRALRSAMGAAGLLPWRRGGLEVLGEEGPAFALELGGRPLDEFDFPPRGIVVVGSEELGVSRQALERCSLGRVSIPMRGAKASINAGVAFGVILNAWASRIATPGH